QAIVVPSLEDAHRAAEWLRAKEAGRALLLWLDASATSPDAPQRTEMPPADGDDLLGYARDAATCRAELRALIARTLGDTYVVRDLATAERHWGGRNLRAPLVTLEGELLHPNSWLRGGRGKAAPGGVREASVLARERDLRQLPAEVDRQAATIAEVQAQHE